MTFCPDCGLWHDPFSDCVLRSAMPYSQNIATCLHCGRKWVVGDCIPSICDECRAAGHADVFFADCPRCREPLLRILAAQYAADEEAKAEAAAREAEARARAAEEAEFSAGIL